MMTWNRIKKMTIVVLSTTLLLLLWSTAVA